MANQSEPAGPANAPTPQPRPPEAAVAFSRVVVPLDGSTPAEKALAYAPEIARRFSARLLLLRAYEGEQQSARVWATMPAGPVSSGVDPNTYRLIEESAKAAEQDARAYLDERAKSLAAEGLAVDTLMIDSAPADAILEQARREPGTLVVMCTHGRGGLDRLVFGSTAQDVLAKVETPLLLVRVYEDSDLTRKGAGMDISIGADVIGSEGRLGEVYRVVVDARTDTITDLVVRHGRFFGRERILPLGRVARVEGGVIHVNLDDKGFEALDGYADDRLRAPDPSYVGPPGFRNEDFLMDVTVAEGPTIGLAGGPTPVLGFPGGEQITPDDTVRPTVEPGDNVLDSTGEKVGEVHSISFDARTGAPTHLVIRSGFLF
ncbi:MAG: universal stress protein, partial [Candidatus Rokubacteria bacterium]|nr:universal stress protein [Candidatus Rokubacteria bacterium]